MAMADEVKVISFKSAEISRRITINLCRRIAGGMEVAGDVFSKDGVKTGFYRYRSQFEFPVFFSEKGKRLYGDNPINKAIKEVVHSWAASVNTKRK